MSTADDGIPAGYGHRPGGFPRSVVLCGGRGIRDYRIRSSAGEVIAGGSPFNVAAKSLRRGGFTFEHDFGHGNKHPAHRGDCRDSDTRLDSTGAAPT